MPHSTQTREHSKFGENAVNKLVDSSDDPSIQQADPEIALVLKTIRLLIADLCQQFNGGHPGGAIGMAAIGVALWKNVMKYAPHSPDYFNRDRFVLSNGHCCLLQYVFLHLTGYKAMTMEQLKSYHSKRYDALCPGHPEIEHAGVEVTTGPLGQGIANAVGLAVAEKNLSATYNKPGFPVVSNHVWCMTGDACLQEGVGLEAISLAGHWKLNNLTLIYDNNQVTCDGAVSITDTENINAKMESCGWRVVDVLGGSYDVAGLTQTLEASRHADRPTFVNVRTVIGLGSAVAGNATAHGAAFGVADVGEMKRAYGFDPEQHFVVPEPVRAFFSDLPSRGKKAVSTWETLFASYQTEFPELGRELQARLSGEIPADWKALIPKTFPDKATASRASSGLVFNPIAEQVNSFLVGTADLSPSVNMAWKTRVPFQHPEKAPGKYSGRYLHYGIREHAMAAISNGLAAYCPGAIIPVTSSFFMFYLYAAPAVRMRALQHLHIIHAATHDSIGMGEDGPTHQPIELAVLYRSMPNLLYMRPADSEETAGAWITAIEAKGTPSIISTSRHALPQLAPKTQRDKVQRGAYVLEEDEDADLTLLSAGAELNIATQAAARLRESEECRVRVVSVPCQRLFERQEHAYKKSVLGKKVGRATVAVEAYAANGWERYASAAVCMSTDRFGQSLPGPVAYEYFGFTVDQVVSKLKGYMRRVREEPELLMDFVEMTEADGEAVFRRT